MSGTQSSRINFGRSVHSVRSFGGHLSVRLDTRSLFICLALLVLSVCVTVFSLLSGKYPITLTDILRAFTGDGDAQVRMIVMEWRLPRIALAFLLGAALAMSGAIFQSLTRNPLGSPDIIGFSAGSYTGALVVMLLFSGGYYETAIGALIGGILTAIAVYLLAYQRGVQGFRLIIVGIGVAAMLSSFNIWMIREAELQIAMSAAIWGAGSLNGLGFEQLGPVFIALSVVAPLVIFLSRTMAQLEMGDDIARASGVNSNRVRVALMVLGVALTAIVTAAAGPISFIALAAPQIARRLNRSADVALVPSALMGGLLLLAADWAAQHAFRSQLPVGVMTVSIGGLYFVWLLIREVRK